MIGFVSILEQSILLDGFPVATRHSPFTVQMSQFRCHRVECFSSYRRQTVDAGGSGDALVFESFLDVHALASVATLTLWLLLTTKPPIPFGRANGFRLLRR